MLAACVPDAPGTSGDDSQTDSSGAKTTGPESTTGSCPIGMLGCPCTGGGACDPGLVCGPQLLCQAGGGESTDAQTTTEDASAGTSTDTTTVDPSSGSSTGEATECTPSGDGSKLSEQCQAIDPGRPFCAADGACIGCDMLDQDACATATAGVRPICMPGGACGQCDSPDALALGQCGEASPHCNLDTASCEGCFEHSECPQTACDVKARKCFPTNKIIYVRRGPTPASPCTGTPGAGGTMVKPYCDIETAITGVNLGGYSSGYTFYVMPSDDPSDHREVVIPGGADTPVSYAFVHAPGGPFDPHTRFLAEGPMITVPTNVTLYVVNFSILLSNDAFLDSAVGVDCQPLASVWLDDSRVFYARGVGVRGEDCQIHLRRTSVSFGFSEGVELTGGSLNMTNSFITENSYKATKGGGALRLRPGITGDPKVNITYSTLVNNANEPLLKLGDTINCEGKPTVTVRNSILGRKPGTGNASVVCPEGSVSISRSVVDGDFDQGGNKKLAAEDILKHLKSNSISGAYRIPSPASATVFADVAQWQLGDVHFDYELQPRNATPGAPDYAGADVYNP